jgi:hypothetical protein
MKINEQLRYFGKKMPFVQKNSAFNLKVALFVEKRKNLFAQYYK